jgi:hypothetical protein
MPSDEIGATDRETARTSALHDPLHTDRPALVVVHPLCRLGHPLSFGPPIVLWSVFTARERPCDSRASDFHQDCRFFHNDASNREEKNLDHVGGGVDRTVARRAISSECVLGY